MKPKPRRTTKDQPVIGWELDLALDPNHELVRLATKIPWDDLTQEFGRLYVPDLGRPGIPIRLMAGLHLLKHTYALSDEAVVKGWVENPYWQHFCGEVMFQHHFPINPSQMTRWRKRIGEKGVEKLLQATIHAGMATGAVTEQSFEKVIVDTTVQPKAVQHPTDARLYRKVHAAMLRIAGVEGIKLRQSYRKLMEWGIRKHGGYAKAKQFKRARKVMWNLKSMAGRVMRDVERKMDDAAFQKHNGTLILSELILTQKRTTRGKVYSLHAPEVECIAKGKAQNVILCGAGHNMRKILAHLRALLRLLMGEPRKAIQALIDLLESNSPRQQAFKAA